MSSQPCGGEPELEVVHVAQGHLQAAVLKAKLEAAGIPVLLTYESAGLIFGVTVDGLGQVKLLVPAGCAEDARRLLEEDEAPLDYDPEITDPDI